MLIIIRKYFLIREFTCTFVKFWAYTSRWTSKFMKKPKFTHKINNKLNS